MDTRVSDEAANLHEMGPQSARSVIDRAFEALRTSWRVPVLASLVTAFVLVGGFALARLAIPSTRTFVAQFQFTFPSVTAGKYPNGFPFSLNDVIEPAVLSELYRELQLEQHGVRQDRFYSGFSIRPFGPAQAEITERFRQHLADRRLTFAERERLEAQLKAQLEQASRSAAELTFSIRSRLPIATELGRTIVQSVPLIWSRVAINKKGVLLFPDFYASEAALPADAVKDKSLPMVIVHVFHAGSKLTSRLQELRLIPGLASMQDGGASFRDLEREVQLLEVFRLNELIGFLLSYDLGQDLGQVRLIVERRIRDLELEEGKANANVEAIGEATRQFVEAVAGLSGRGADRRPAGAEQGTFGGSTIPQISEGFIDRLLNLTDPTRAVHQSFVSDMTQRQLLWRERLITIRTERERWKELIAGLGSGRIVADNEASSRFMDQAIALLTEVNRLWGTLTRLQSQFSINRLAHTGQLYSPFAVADDVRVAHPILNLEIVIPVAILLLGLFFALWVIFGFMHFKRLQAADHDPHVSAQP